MFGSLYLIIIIFLWLLKRKKNYIHLLTYEIITNSYKKEGLRKLEQVLYENQRSQNDCGHSLGHGQAQGNRY